MLALIFCKNLDNKPQSINQSICSIYADILKSSTIEQLVGILLIQLQNIVPIVKREETESSYEDGATGALVKHISLRTYESNTATYIV